MDEQQLQQQIILLVLAAMLGNLLATQQILQIMQAAQQGDQLAMQIAQMIQTVALLMQQQLVQAAKFGAKLNYIRRLRGLCPEGQELQYYKQGGQLCKKCVQKKLLNGKKVPSNPVDAFRRGRKVKLPRRIIEEQGMDVIEGGGPGELYSKTAETIIDNDGTRFLSRIIATPDTIYVTPLRLVWKDDPMYNLHREVFERNEQYIKDLKKRGWKLKK